MLFSLSLVDEKKKSQFNLAMVAALCGAALINLWLFNENKTDFSLESLKPTNLQAKEQDNGGSNEVSFRFV